MTFFLLVLPSFLWITQGSGARALRVPRERSDAHRARRGLARSGGDRQGVHPLRGEAARCSGR